MQINVTDIDTSINIDTDGAIDAEVDFHLNGELVVGLVTLVPGEDGSLSRWGNCPDHWLSMSILDAMGDEFDAELADAIEDAVRKATR